MGGRFGEILLILILLLLFFGPNKLPDMGRSIGKALAEFKKALGGEGSAPSQTPAQSAVVPAPAKKTRKSSSRKIRAKK